MQEAKPRSVWFTVLLRIAGMRFITISALIHLVLILLAGGVVIVHAVNETQPFEASTGEASKAEVIVPPSPPVQVPVPDPTQTAPPAPTQAIDIPINPMVTQSTNVSNFVLPPQPVSISSIGAMPGGVGHGGVGGGEGMPGVGQPVTPISTGRLGTGKKLESALVGTFYDLKQTRNRHPANGVDFHAVFRKFISSGWHESVMNGFYRSSQPIYATQIFTTSFSADDGPKSFGLEKEVQPTHWLVHYKGRVSPSESGTYHFVGAGDDVMVASFDGHVVLDRCWYGQQEQMAEERNFDYGWGGIPSGFAEGPAFVAKAGQFYDMDVLIGEEPGGRTFAALLIEKEGEQYEHDNRGNPILPIFRLADSPVTPHNQDYAPHADGGPVWVGTTAPPPGDFEKFFQRIPAGN